MACSGSDDDDQAPVTPSQALASSTPEASSTPQPTATTAPSPATTPTATSEPSQPPQSPGAEAATEAAREALLMWLGPAGDAASLALVEVEVMTWNDGCLGLSRPGLACLQVITPGFRVTFALGSATYKVRTNESGSAVAWAPQVMVLVTFESASTNVIEFRTDDGNALVTRAVPGTQFGAQPNTLESGNPVGIAIVDAPQGGDPLLVWMDPLP